jgi:hypothetical protein
MKFNHAMLRVYILVLLLTHAAALLAQTATTSGSWKIVPSPNGAKCKMPYPLCLTPEEGNVLYATGALSSTDVWAVGAEPHQSSVLTATLAEHWDGTQWSVVPTPPIPFYEVQLNSISALRNNEVWAAGFADNVSCQAGVCGQSLVERWNGRSWTKVKTSNPGLADYLYGVAAISLSDVWVGGQEWASQSSVFPVLMHYDGTNWKSYGFSQLQLGEIAAVFALAPNDVWAVGWYGTVSTGKGLALHWNGKSWKVVPFPTDNLGVVLLRSVSGSASDDVWAVGNVDYYGFYGELEESARSYHWNGSSWKQVDFPLGGYSYVNAVSARATDDVWAVGAGNGSCGFAYCYATVHWDGNAWSEITNPNSGILLGVTTSSPSDAWAVGDGFNARSGYPTGTYTLHYTVP